MSARQLLLPGLGRREEDWCTAQRDLSARAFARALGRNGFRPIRSGFAFVDETGRTDQIFTAVHRSNPIRVRRRKTLAKIIKERDRP